MSLISKAFGPASIFGRDRREGPGHKPTRPPAKESNRASAAVTAKIDLAKMSQLCESGLVRSQNSFAYVESYM